MRTSVHNEFNVALINARSVIPKLLSLEETLRELNSDFAIITKTWLQDTPRINQCIIDFTDRTGLEFIRKDRSGGRRGGGVAVCFNKNLITFSKAKIPPSKHELVAAVGRMTGQRRKVVVLGAYLPPHYNAEQNVSFMNATNKALTALKSKYANPYIFFGGDLNRRNFRDASREAPDIKLIPTGPTRGNATLDSISLSLIHI